MCTRHFRPWIPTFSDISDWSGRVENKIFFSTISDHIPTYPNGRIDRKRSGALIVMGVGGPWDFIILDPRTLKMTTLSKISCYLICTII